MIGVLAVSVSKGLGEFELNSSFDVQNGILAVLGASGSGKSLTLKCIAGLIEPESGHVVLNGRTLFSSEKKINIPPHRRNIGYVFQNYALFPHLTVAQNIAFGIGKMENRIKKQKVQEFITKMQLEGYENHYPCQISGGQQQRTALARTLITEPELLLLDEPFSALDSHVKMLLEEELMNNIRKNYSGLIILVTHDVQEAYRLSDQILIFDKGRTVQMGTKEEILYMPNNENTARLTGCTNFFAVNVAGEEAGALILESGGLTIRTRERIKWKSDKLIAGIHAHNLKILSDAHGYCSNTYGCEIIQRTDGIFSAQLKVRCGSLVLDVTVSKFSCPHISNHNNKLKLHIPPDKVFVLDNSFYN